jgi:chromosomal replication initiation ATPase DnaA
MTGDKQLIFDLTQRPAFGREDFMVTQSNSAALALIDRWPNWTGGGAMIVGPPGSGKTHLVEVFRNQANLAVAAAEQLATGAVPLLMAGDAVVVENAVPGKFDETAFFHLLNLARQHGKLVLVTAATPASLWQIELPDLRTRLQALPVVPILLPDDELLRSVMLKHFHDRQLAIPQSVLNYLVSHMPRSLEAVRHIASEIDRRSMVQRVEITRHFVSEVLRDVIHPSFAGFKDES